MPRRLTVCIGSDGWAALVAEAVRTLPLETGGILLGAWTDDVTAVITDVVGPGPLATHERTSFDPDQTWQESEVARVWASRSGRVQYLGDWHTHPHGRARPSRDDADVAKLIAASPDARASRPLMLIVVAALDGSLKARLHVLNGERFSRARFLVQPAR